MARARSIKPGFFRNADLVELPVETRLLFVGLWTLADRAGRLEDRPKQIKMEIFPADSFDVNSALDDLDRSGFVKRYEIDGKKLIQVLAFSKHQNPHRDEKPSILPSIDGVIDSSTRKPAESTVQATREQDANTVQAQCEVDANTVVTLLTPDSRLLNPDSLTQTPENRAQPEKASPPASQAPEGVESKAVREVFEHWQTVMNHPTAKLGSDRKRIISARLKDGYTVEDLQNAITGCSLSPYHMGQNEQGTRYDGLDLILRNSEKVDSFIAKFRSPPKPLGRQGLLEARNKAIGDEFVNGPNPWSPKPQGDFIDME